MQQSDTRAFETVCGAMAQEGPGSVRREGLTVVQPFQAFPDNAVAKRWFEQQPRPEARFCLHCGLTDAPAVARRKFVPSGCVAPCASGRPPAATVGSRASCGTAAKCPDNHLRRLHLGKRPSPSLQFAN